MRAVSPSFLERLSLAPYTNQRYKSNGKEIVHTDDGPIGIDG